MDEVRPGAVLRMKSFKQRQTFIEKSRIQGRQRFCTDCDKWVPARSDKEWKRHVEGAAHRAAWKRRVYGQ